MAGHDREWRQELKRRCFRSCDVDADGFLSKPEMRTFAGYVGFDGTDKEWEEEYGKICRELRAAPSSGVPEAAVLELLDDQSDTGCFCTDEELMEILGIDDKHYDREADSTLTPKSEEDCHVESEVGGSADGECMVFFIGADFASEEATLRRAFEKGGTVKDLQLYRLPDERSRGMGLVTYASAADAQHAIATLDQITVDGRAISVRPADPSRLRDGGRGRGRAPPGRGADWGGGGGRGAAPRGRGGWADYSVHDNREADHGAHLGYGQSRGGDGRTVFFGGVPFETTSSYLLSQFRAAGRVRAFWLFTLPDGRSRGMGLVQFSSQREARAAVDRLSGANIDGRDMMVMMDQVGAMSSPENADSTRSGGMRRSSPVDSQAAAACESNRLFFAGAPFELPERALCALFEEYGPLRSLTLFRLRDGQSRGMGICTFVSSAAAGEALEGGVQVDGYDLFLQEDVSQYASGPGPPPPPPAPARGWPRGEELAAYGAPPRARWADGYGRAPRFSPYGQAPGAAPSLEVDPRKSVFFANASYDTSEPTLKDHFEEIGRIRSLVLFKTAEGGSKGKGVVEYMNAAAATRAYYNLHGLFLDGRPLTVDEYCP